MATHQNTLKGFVKTENTVLLIVVGLAVGFIAGIGFSAYRSTGSPMAGNNAAVSSIQLNSQQMAAQAELIKQTRDNPKDVEGWTHLGHFLFDAGQPDKAIQAYQTALEIDDAKPDVWTDLGVMYRRSGNPKKAVDCFDRALALNPSHEIAMFNKGIVLMHDIQDPQEALKVWKQLVLTNPEAHTPNGLLVKEMVEELEKTDRK